MTLKGRVTKVAQPLLGAERDEISDLVSRIKRADEHNSRMPGAASPASAKPSVTQADKQWAEDWQLPSEVFEYFVLERAA